ncbi:MAG: hypothetical protein A2W00_06010 [Candidatus Eisenbacteria bacterium RBG_16_71_46]|nr:MAG: hypothetical protein A2W00_06010 [Candidatus Eisenbacteria bacterium RBG_16_71_46]
METRSWQVVIGDLRASRRIPARRRPRVDRALMQAIARTLRRYEGHFRLAPEVLKGDELQAVLRPDAPVLSILIYLRAQLALGVERAPQLRAGIGRGAIERLSPKGPFASDGEAFHRARAALERLRHATSVRLTTWVSGDPAFDATAEAVLGLVDAMAGRWTSPQCEAIIGRLEGKGLDEIARAKGVRFQSVSKRLRAASWNEVQQAVEHLEGLDRSVPAAASSPRKG